jgi:hypothetical protein
MALVLQSNVAATKYLHDMYGTVGNADWGVMLDFENQKFKKKSVSIIDNTFTEEFIFTRNSIAEFTDKNANTVSVEKNVERIAFDQSLLTKGITVGGLLLENARSNYYFPSDAPITKTITLPATSRDWILRVEGTGTMTVSGAITAVITTAGNTTLTAKQGLEVLFKLSDKTVATDVTFTVSGNLTFCQCETAILGYYPSTKIHTTIAQSNRAVENAVATSDLASNLSVSGSIAINVLVPENLLPSTTTAGENWLGGILRLTDGTNDVSIGGNFSARSLRIRRFMNNKEYVFSVSQSKRSNTIAISWGFGTVKVAVNGIYIGESSINENWKPTQLILGGFSSWVTAPFGGIIRRAVIFKNKLNSVDLAKVSESYRVDA